MNMNIIVILMSIIAVIFGGWCFYIEHHGENIKNDQFDSIYEDCDHKKKDK